MPPKRRHDASRVFSSALQHGRSPLLTAPHTVSAAEPLEMRPTPPGERAFAVQRRAARRVHRRGRARAWPALRQLTGIATAFGLQNAAWCDPACGAVWRFGGGGVTAASLSALLDRTRPDNFDVEQDSARRRPWWRYKHVARGHANRGPAVGARVREPARELAREFTTCFRPQRPANEPAVRPRGIRLRPRRAYPPRRGRRRVHGARRAVAVVGRTTSAGRRRTRACGETASCVASRAGTLTARIRIARGV